MSRYNSDRNYDLLVPAALVVIVLRFKGFYNVAQRILYNLKLFLPTSSPIVQSIKFTQRKKRESEAVSNKPIQDLVSKLFLTVIEIDESPSKLKFLSDQQFYELYDVVINLSFCALTSHIFSMWYRCFNPDASTSIWSAILAFTLATVCIQCQLQTIFFTGYRAIETKFALAIGILTFVLVLFYLLSDADWLMLNAPSTVRAAGAHVAICLQNISPGLFESPESMKIEDIAVTLVQTATSMFIAMCACGLALPTLRFTQTFIAMTTGRRHEKVSGLARVMLMLDLVTPLLMAILLSGLPWYYLRKSSGDEDTCSADSCSQALFRVSDEIILSVQISCITVTCMLRLSLFRSYIQSFLDTVLRMVSVQLASGSQKLVDLHAKVTARSMYVISASLQFLCYPCLICAVVILMHKSAPRGMGLCHAFYAYTGWDIAPINARIQVAQSYNASMFFSNSSDYYPNINDVMARTIGVGDGSGVITTSPGARLMITLVKVSHLLHMPVPVVFAGCKIFLCLYYLISFSTSMLSLFFWRFNPELYARASGGHITQQTQASTPTPVSTPTPTPVESSDSEPSIKAATDADAVETNASTAVAGSESATRVTSQSATPVDSLGILDMSIGQID